MTFMQTTIAQLKPMVPFYFVHPHTIKKPSFAQVRHNQEYFMPDTIVWALPEDVKSVKKKD